VKKAVSNQTAGWTIEATSRENYNALSLANGRIGVVPSREPFKIERIMLNGVFDKNDARGVSRMSEGIDFLNSRLTINGAVLTPENISNWKQSLDLKTAALTTSFDYTDAARISYTLRALRQMPYAARMDVSIQAINDIAVAFDNQMRVPRGLTDIHTSFEILRDMEIRMPLFQTTAATQHKKIPITATSVIIFEKTAPVLRETRIGADPAVGFDTAIKSGETFSFVLAGAVCTGTDFYDPKTESERFCISLLLQNQDAVLAGHEAAWAELWENDIIIDGDPASQQAVRFALFNLYGFSRAGTRLSVPPMGLSSQGYNGHVFWDMELWMFPPLLVMNPDLARSAMDYRVDRLAKARQKAENFGYRGAMFPWQSDGSGEEATASWAVTGTFEQHITADIGIAVWNFFRVTGDKAWLRESGYPLLRDIADFWVSRVTRNPDGSYSIINVVGADEFAQNIDDNAFTNGSAIRALQFADQAAKVLGVPADPAWTRVAGLIKIHQFPDGVTREYATYQGAVIKQADANLLIYPLGLITDPARIKKDLEYYEPRMAANGPAMGHSVMSVIYCRLGNADKAFKLFQQSYQPNSKPPFGVLSESPNSNNPYFATGAGGMLQAVIFGFGGLEITDQGLAQGKPCLPRHWKSLEIRGLGLKNGSVKIEGLVS
jgi:trehalose/maltose hydrolase-like predicted phosphorylase